MNRESYPTDLADVESKIVESLIPPVKPAQRLRETDMRDMLNAIFYLLRTGCAPLRGISLR